MGALSKEQLILLAETHKVFNSTMMLRWSFERYVNHVISEAVKAEQEIAANSQKVKTEVIAEYLNSRAVH